jgi:hypothetical protein
VVTLLVPALEPDEPVESEATLDPEDPVELEPALEFAAVPVLPLVAVVTVPLLVPSPEATATVDVLRASAGSCPETSTTAINSQAARNSATAPATTRRRIVRIRPARAARRASPRARASGLGCSWVMSLSSVPVDNMA